MIPSTRLFIIRSLVLASVLLGPRLSTTVSSVACIDLDGYGPVRFISHNESVKVVSFEADLVSHADRFSLEGAFGLQINGRFYLPVGEARFVQANNQSRLLNEFESMLGTPYEFIAKNSKTEHSVEIRCFGGILDNIIQESILI